MNAKDQNPAAEDIIAEVPAKGEATGVKTNPKGAESSEW